MGRRFLVRGWPLVVFRREASIARFLVFGRNTFLLIRVLLGDAFGELDDVFRGEGAFGLQGVDFLGIKPDLVQYFVRHLLDPMLPRFFLELLGQARDFLPEFLKGNGVIEELFLGLGELLLQSLQCFLGHPLVRKV